MDDRDMWKPPEAKPEPEECKQCDNGWRQVLPSYGERMFPVKHDPEEEARVKPLRASANTSVYPCKACKPELFFRWAGLHLDPDHEWWKCDECKDLPGRKHRT